MNGRYQPDLISFVGSVVAGNQYRAGYYSAPYYGTGPTDHARMLDTQSGLDWLTNWLVTNQNLGANSYYIDTLAREYYGDPATVMALFQSGRIPGEALLEGVVDIYPAAGLVSGALVGDRCGAPQKTPENSTTTMFPRFGRYLLGDRLMYSGESNTDWRFWGAAKWWQLTTDGGMNSTCGYTAYCNANGPCEYWTETQSFLLGTKLDVMHPANDPVLDAINQERRRVNWWSRRPAYLDTKGLDLTRVPQNSRVELRRFQDANGVQLIAISNPGLVAGLTFGFNNMTFSIPAQTVAVMEIVVAQ
jgi:hypothetical protein